jgi:hypothetical protein
MRTVDCSTTGVDVVIRVGIVVFVGVVVGVVVVGVVVGVVVVGVDVGGVVVGGVVVGGGSVVVGGLEGADEGTEATTDESARRSNVSPSSIMGQNGEDMTVVDKIAKRANRMDILHMPTILAIVNMM